MNWKSTQVLIGLVLGAAMLLLAGCNLETGSGNLVTEERDVAGFESVLVSDGIRVVINVEASAGHTVSVRYDDNLIDNLITRVEGTRLVVEFDGAVNVAGGRDRAVEITMPALELVDASGGASVKATGRVDLYRIRASGGASVLAGELNADDVDVDVSGGASVRVRASSSVTGDASGGASVKVVGSPPSVRVDTSGGASVDS